MFHDYEPYKVYARNFMFGFWVGGGGISAQLCNDVIGIYIYIWFFCGVELF